MYSRAALEQASYSGGCIGDAKCAFVIIAPPLRGMVNEAWGYVLTCVRSSMCQACHDEVKHDTQGVLLGNNTRPLLQLHLPEEGPRSQAGTFVMLCLIHKEL